jgi:Protein of unknown function (DUF2934)
MHLYTDSRSEPKKERIPRFAKGTSRLMQTRLSPAHPDAGKVSLAELENRIRNRAYQLYEHGGGVYADGHALDDWLEAKAEVLGVTKNPVADERS